MNIVVKLFDTLSDLDYHPNKRSVCIATLKWNKLVTEETKAILTCAQKHIQGKQRIQHIRVYDDCLPELGQQRV
jgi:hypothetical protein